MKWETLDGYQKVMGKTCYITLEPRPHYCDRGNWIAKIFGWQDMEFKDWNALSLDERRLDIDGHDGWPRYYFDQERAKLEIEAWLIKRKQAV